MPSFSLKWADFSCICVLSLELRKMLGVASSFFNSKLLLNLIAKDVKSPHI